MARQVMADAGLDEEFTDRGYVLVDLLSRQAAGELLRRWQCAHAGTHRAGISPTITSGDVQARAAADRDVAVVLDGPLRRRLASFRPVHHGFVAKSPASPHSGMELHQDFSVVDERHLPSVTVWCPLVDVTDDNGPLGVVPGSHRLNPHPRQPGVFPYPALAPLIHERYVTHVLPRAGQAVLMHPATFHTSPPNLGPKPRVVAAVMAVPEEAPLVYCHPGPTDAELELHHVDDGFYQRHRLGLRPTDAREVTVVPRQVAPLSPADLDRATAAHQIPETRTAR